MGDECHGRRRNRCYHLDRSRHHTRKSGQYPAWYIDYIHRLGR